MSTLDRLLEISSRIDHLEAAAEWVAKETVHSDNSLSQTGTLIGVLADDIRARLVELVQVLEKKSDLDMMN